MDKEYLYRKAIRTWGVLAQVDMAVEECAELIKALQKRKRVNCGTSVDNILEEMADVEIMLEQLKEMFDYKTRIVHGDVGYTNTSKFEQFKRMKLNRLEKLLE